MLKKIASVVLEKFTEKCFDYLVPDIFSSSISEGMRVSIPFGNRHTNGYVVALKDHSDVKNLKEIAGLIDSGPILDQKLFKIVKWISEYYCCPIGSVIKAAIPAKARDIKQKKSGTEYIKIERKPSPDEFEKIKKKSPKQHAILSMLINDDAPLKLKQVKKSYNVSQSVIQSLVQKGIVSIVIIEEAETETVEKLYERHQEFILTEEQKTALDKIDQAADNNKFRTFLLFGVTGSGKTEIYLRAIRRLVDKGKGAIVLVPEISLTPQTVGRFRERFGDNVAVLHSALTATERFAQWKRIRDGKAQIVVGARSSIFAPVKNLGLIVVDEEHDKSFKQDNTPRYNARDVAVMRASLNDAVVVLGSATPSLESFNNVKRGKYELLELTKRVDNKKMPRVGIVDMKLESERAKTGVVFSYRLIRGIEERLKRNEQVILFLNRRGYSSFSICDECGNVVKCDNCSISMTYHEYGKRLLCHMCGHQKEVLQVCANCGSKIRHGGCGTQKVQEMVSKFFPTARVARMDTDSTTFRGSHADILGRFKEGKIDVLVGTQMIAKGLDFPNVTLVGVINADTALNFPDFRCGEFTFQLLTQVAGRSGRGDVEGEVIIQTFLPNHYAIEAARRQDYNMFYEKEFEFRRQLGYPPVFHFVSVITAGKNEGRVMEASIALEKEIQKRNKDYFQILSAVPAPLSRVKRDFRWQIILKSKGILKINEVLQSSINSIKLRHGTKFYVDVDPQILM